MRWLDVLLATVALVALAPVLLLLAVAVAVTSPGPVLFRARRVGRHGRPFVMWKFRTMRTGAGGSGVTASGDARVTSLGRWLRRTHLDELPQLVNVVAGDMALVGPRPEDPRFVDLADPAWAEVLSVRPGLAGPTQRRFAAREARELVGPDPERLYVERLLPEKLASDRAYVRSRSVRRDLREPVAALRGSPA